MAEFLLRPATETDFPAIRRLIHEARINPTGLNWRRFIVAETVSGEFAGCGQIKPHPQGMLELASIAIQPAYRDHGLASQIIQHLLADEPQRPIYLTCRSELGTFYQKFGFRALESNQMPAYYRRLSTLANLFLSLSGRRLLVMALDAQETVV